MIDPTTFTKAQEAYDYLGVTEEQVKAYFLRLEKVMHHIIATLGCDPESAKGYWVSGINPYYSQLRTISKRGLGLGLVEYYGVPHKLATPFGSISFTSCVGDVEWFEPLKNVLGLKPLWGDEIPVVDAFDEITHDMLRGYDHRDGTFGPVWEISYDVDGVPFDEADFYPAVIDIPDMRTAFGLSPEVVDEVWAACAPDGFKAARSERPLYERRSSDN